MNIDSETKFCQFCGERIAFNAVICPKCGRQIEEIEISYKNIKAPKKKKLSTSKLLICIFGIYIVIAAGIGSSTPNKKTTQTQINTLLTQTMNLTQPQTQKISEILKACDIGEITYCNEEKRSETETKYALSDKEIDYYTPLGYVAIVTVDNNTKSIKEISFNDHKIYANNKIISKVTDHYINQQLRMDYRVNVENYITKLLNYPKSAKFGTTSHWAFVVTSDGYDSISSEVEAKNAFGMESKLPFKVLIDRGQAKVMYTSLDGTVYVNKIK